MPWPRVLGLLSLALLVIAGLAWGFWPRPLVVDAALVREAPLTVTVDEEGRTRVKDRFVISAPVAGYLRRIQLEVGDPVTWDQVLACLEPSPSPVLDPRSRAEAEARVSRAQAALRMAEERNRMEELRRERTVPQQELDEARSRDRQAGANLRSARFAVEVARFELAAAQTALEYADGGGDERKPVPLRAPVNGSVLKLLRKSEGVVRAGEPLIEVGDPMALEVEVDLLSADAVRVHPGTQVRLERWGGEGTLDALVRTVEPVGFTKVSALGVEEQRVWVIADLTSPHERWEALGDGYRVEASFVLWHGEQVLQIPTSALFRRGDGQAVFVIADGRARLRPVVTGQRAGLVAQVVEGLAAGETVITHPDDRIADGVRVSPRGGR
ncbi:MAG: efflux RND transporter periplasmic adaptor subunit [Chromatiaceae bacterium]|nr:efflux RND transporter periplasmic adaptor subunit [Chromatiaceae bacterium]